MSKVEKYLNEKKRKEGGGLGGFGPGKSIDLQAMPSKKVANAAKKVGSAAGYSIEEVYQAVLYLLTDVNAHSVVSDVERIFHKDLGY